jgi:short-subunit dehydrogenase
MTTALITGASAGLGAEFAKQLAADGHDVVLVARSQERLEQLSRDLTTTWGVDVEVLPADLATSGGLDAVAERIADAGRPIDVLVNNAGLGLGGRFVDNELDVEVAALDLMVKAVMVLSHASALAMSTRGHGAILNVSSVASWLGSGTYAAHKAWVTSFSEGLAGELRGTGVTVTAVLPGLTRTEFHDRAGLDHYYSAPGIVWLRASHVVKSALRASRRGKVLVTPSARYAVAANISRVLPRTWVRALTRAR